MDDFIVEEGNSYSASLVVNPYPSARSFALLWNPGDSAFNMYVDRVVLNHAGPGADGFDFRKATTKAGTFVKNGINKNFSIPDLSPFQLLYGNAPMTALAPDSNIIHEAWQDCAWKEGNYKHDILCPPGMGLMICAATDARYLIATFHFRKKALV